MLPSMDLAIQFFGYKLHISIERKFSLIQKGKMTDVTVNDGAPLRVGLLNQAIRRIVQTLGFFSDFHRRQPHLKLMPQYIQLSNTDKSIIRPTCLCRSEIAIESVRGYYSGHHKDRLSQFRRVTFRHSGKPVHRTLSFGVHIQMFKSHQTNFSNKF